MSGLARDLVGISPAGALGVAFYYYLNQELAAKQGGVVFLERTGSASASALREAPSFHIVARGRVVEVPAKPIQVGTLLDAYRAARLPQVVLVCANPDQLFSYVTDFVKLLELQDAEGKLLPGGEDIPYVLLLANGIYFQRFRQVLIEKVEESTLLGRLPDLWPDVMPRIVGRWLRGVTVQTALRDGAGADAVYRPGPRNRTTVAGGDPLGRSIVCTVLSSLGGWFEDAGGASPTRVEFLKAFVNLNSNLLGLLEATDDSGGFRPLRLKEIYQPGFLPKARELISVVFEIGKAVHAFRANESLEPIFEECVKLGQHYPEHVPSSLQWVEQQIRAKRLAADIPPTEGWLLNPLLHYARSAGLQKETRYLEEIRDRLVQRLSRVRQRMLAP